LSKLYILFLLKVHPDIYIDMAEMCLSVPLFGHSSLIILPKTAAFSDGQ